MIFGPKANIYLEAFAYGIRMYYKLECSQVKNSATAEIKEVIFIMQIKYDIRH